ncbi:MAG: tRNA uridine-5-carboxymethylaminomethyl(34) synthesis GTPase MnmE [Spirochaeta sp.]|nr:tRNA uridine-5-carboxymethylaminomethyl(34) synthesis GTPase MnmE [Spirochaeta sp.]
MKHQPVLESHDPIYALATPYGRSALAVLRVSGEGCLEVLAAAFSRPSSLADCAGNTLLYGRIYDRSAAPAGELAATPERNAHAKTIDEVMLAVYRAPKSYTGEDSVEIMCHGSPAGIERIVGVLADLGMRPAEAGEFTRRAFLGGKLDLTQAEAIQELVEAETGTAHALALNRLSGGLSRRIESAKQRVLDLTAAVAIQLDYAEEDTGLVELPVGEVEALQSELQVLADSFQIGRVFREGASIALAGRTNAGKSSLFNLLLREDRAIVSAEAGTTRDYLEARLDIEGVPVRLIDTAGLRLSESEIESEGMRRSRQLMENVDLVLYLVDSAEGPNDEDRALIADLQTEGRCVVVYTKRDLLPDSYSASQQHLVFQHHAGSQQPAGSQQQEAPTLVSSVSGEGLGDLHAVLVRRLVPGEHTDTEAVVIDSRRHRDLLLQAVAALNDVQSGLAAGTALDLVAVDLQEALQSLGEITGEVASSEILERMFGSFCVGK